MHVQEAGGFFDVEHAVPLATAIDGQGAGRWLLNSGIVQLAHGTHLFGGAVPEEDVWKRSPQSTAPIFIGTT